MASMSRIIQQKNAEKFGTFHPTSASMCKYCGRSWLQHDPNVACPTDVKRVSEVRESPETNERIRKFGSARPSQSAVCCDCGGTWRNHNDSTCTPYSIDEGIKRARGEDYSRSETCVPSSVSHQRRRLL